MVMDICARFKEISLLVTCKRFHPFITKSKKYDNFVLIYKNGDTLSLSLCLCSNCKIFDKTYFIKHEWQFEVVKSRRL